jgi:hypothetical protein
VVMYIIRHSPSLNYIVRIVPQSVQRVKY